ncbi:hypothetical protein OH492_12745 [Vibrio chagasii]|nr:hypothetical protein [Vibrio chagasii]
MVYKDAMDKHLNELSKSLDVQVITPMAASTFTTKRPTSSDWWLCRIACARPIQWRPLQHGFEYHLSVNDNAC